ncbi:MAG: hypothetical protein WC390_08670 [Sulfurimonas sp.]|jgi:hypothetical protein
MSWEEIQVKRNGTVYQAGAPEYSDGEFQTNIRSVAEKSLFFFAKAVIGRNYLTNTLHLPICDFLQRRPPFRKGLLMPRGHAKSSMVAHCLPPHILIQPAATNIYFPSLPGSDCRILLAGETQTMAERNLRVIQSIFESNTLFRALWPDRTFKNPSKESRKWNAQEMTIPRENEYPDASIRAVGVGVAVTGSRPNVMIKDDLISVEARNSDVVMRRAIEWHVASRALFDEYPIESGLSSLEIIVGTRWSVFDLYSYIEQEDPTVEWNKDFRSMISGGEMIWPEKFSLHTMKDKEGNVLKEGIEDLKKQFGSLFPLLYMNDASDPDLVDFDMSLVRQFELKNGMFVYSEDLRDTLLSKEVNIGSVGLPEGATMSSQQVYDEFLKHGRGEYMRLRYA